MPNGTLNQSTHPVTVNGSRLDTYAHNIETKQGWVATPGLRGKNPVPAGRHGSLWYPGRKREDGRMLLNMWASSFGINEETLFGTDKYRAWRQNMDRLLALFDSTYALLDVRQDLGSGNLRQALCEVSGGFDPEMFGNIYGRFTVELGIPDAFWQDVAVSVWDSVAGAGAAGVNLQVTPLAGMTAPLTDLVLRLTGPTTNAPKIIDVRTGHFVQLNEPLADGAFWTVDGAAFTSSVGGASRTTLTTSSGVHLPYLFALSPAALLGTPVIRLEAAGAGLATQLQVTGRRKYL